MQNAEEFLACQAIAGAISYNPTDAGDPNGFFSHRRVFDAFTIDFSSLGYSERTLTTGMEWDTTVTAGYQGDPFEDFLNCKRDISDASGLAPTHAIFGRAASTAFVKLQQVRDLLDNRRLLAGNIDLTNAFTDQGALFLGSFAGVQCWEYQRQMELFPKGGFLGTDESNAGSAAANLPFPNLIPDDAVIFLALTPMAEFTMYYGGIEDLPQLEGRMLSAKRFSKSWQTEDPPTRYVLLESHPLPFLRRPGAVCRLNPLE